jgi:hypothetical protein
MKNIKIATTTSVEINLTAAQWDLYDSTMECGNAARALNKRLEASINKGLERNEVRKEVEKVMLKYSEYGAYDTEPCAVLEHILDKVFGDNYED